MMIKPAIVTVGYNRPEGIKRLLDSIGRAKFEQTDIPLIISIDESDKSDEVERVAREFHWAHGTKEIRRFPERQGLRKHIVQCGDYSEKYGSVIILEDDLIVAEDFYTYVCKAHDMYSSDERVCGIALYSYRANVFTHFPFEPMFSPYDVYRGDMIVTWGQSWTAKQWSNFKAWYLAHEDQLPQQNRDIPRDISGWKRSWGKYFASYMADRHMSYIYPYAARTSCFSDFGEHNTTSVPLTYVQVRLMQGCPDVYKFGKLDDLVHYDSFFDRVLKPDQCVMGIPGDQICFDLSNMKTYSAGKPYLVTDDVLPLKKIGSFGMTMRPISMNVVCQIPGTFINLYQFEQGNDEIRPWKGKHCWYHFSYRRIKYEYFDASWRILMIYAPSELWNRFQDLIKSLIKKAGKMFK